MLEKIKKKKERNRNEIKEIKTNNRTKIMFYIIYL